MKHNRKSAALTGCTGIDTLVKVRHGFQLLTVELSESADGCQSKCLQQNSANVSRYKHQTVTTSPDGKGE